MKDAYQIIKRPVITEKANLAKEEANQLVFEVVMDANKVAIRRAIEELFDVKVLRVQTQVVPGKTKRQGRHWGKTPKWKKAVVKLAPGDTIDFFEGM
jgi:large subunit ribosomal protein L23